MIVTLATSDSWKKKKHWSTWRLHQWDVSPFSGFASESKSNISQVEPIQRKAEKEDRQTRPKIKRLRYIKMKTKMKSELDKDEHEKQQSKKPTQDGERGKKRPWKEKLSNPNEKKHPLSMLTSLSMKRFILGWYQWR